MIHNLTTKQLRKLVDAIGNGETWPKATDDPRVNHAIDCIVSDDGEEPVYNKDSYLKETKATRTKAL